MTIPSRILIVEDEAITALDLKQELITLGYEVVGIADNAVDAVKAANTLKPDLVLMDIRLSGDEDGVIAASAIRGSDDLPVVFLTAHADEATLQRALNTSPFGYILKPFQVRDLRVSIEVALYKHQKERQVRQLVQQLTDALKSVRVLSGLVTMCAHCKKIRDPNNRWQHMEAYLEGHSEAKFSHGLCPDCQHSMYPKIDPAPPSPG